MGRENRRSFGPLMILAMMGLVALLVAGGDLYSSTVAFAQDDQMGALSEEYAQLESQGMKENFIRQVSFTILQEFLPPGTRMTSGYRSPEKQLDLIMRMAKSKGVPTPDHPSVADESSWRGPLMALRAKGFIIASPTNTPHATEEDVFDMSGAELNAIQDGCRQAEKAGKLKFKRILFEVQNNAVHVEIESIDPKALNVLGRRRTGSSGSSSSGDTTATANLSPAEQKQKMLQQLQDMHDGEPDPLKKIDYDKSRKNLMDPATDSDKISAIDAEIMEHQKEAQQLGADAGKREAIEDMSRALREDRYDDAEKAAQFLERKYPNTKEAQAMLAQIKTRRLILGAIKALDSDDCGECDKAGEMIDKALQLSPNHAGARIIREDIDACQKRCRTRRLPIIILVAFLLSVAIAGGWYLFSRSGKWFTRTAARSEGMVLQGTAGQCVGHTYILDKPEIVIGSKGPPAGVADIVITDAEGKISRRHCTVANNGRQFFVMDESTNGTFVNDQPIGKNIWIEIHSGDRISLAAKAALMLRPR